MLSVCQGRAQAVEARLAATTAELQRLKAQQQKLQATNLLLEKMSQLDRQNSNPPAAVVSVMAVGQDMITDIMLSTMHLLVWWLAATTIF